MLHPRHTGRGHGRDFPGGSGRRRLVPADDLAAATQALDELLSNEADRRARGQAARRQAELHWDCQRSARQLLQHYRELAVGNG